jgi:hypothetical protein
MPTSESARNAPALPSRPARWAWLGHGLIYGASLLLSALVIARWLPYPEIPGAGEKIRYLARHGNDYDTIFIGSSRVNFQILPSIYDRAMKDAGRATKSFNAGLLGMRPPEQGCFLDQVLKQPRGRLRWVFVELTSLEARTPPSRRGSARYLAWHDAPRMGLLTTWLRAEWADGGDRWEPLSVWGMHFGYFCQQTLNLGRGSFVGEAWMLTPSERAKQRNKFRALGEARDGWLPYDGAREMMNDEERAAYLESYEARLVTPAVPFHDPASDAATEAMRQAVLQTGATPIFFVPPMTTDRYYSPPPEMGRNMIIWNFSDPKRYPQLFLPEHRLDHIHLNTAGGKLFTRALAERFGELSR